MTGRERGGGGAWRRAGLALGMATLVACSTVRPRVGITHRVKPGENLYRIGLAYGIPHAELARLNRIAKPDRIEVGQRVFVPNATRELPVAIITPVSAQAARPAAPELPRGRTPFVWPVEGGAMSSAFGPRGETHHDGVDIRCDPGTPVRAARAGRVLYADELRGYGKVVIVEHDEGYATVYAHNRENLARAGQAVAQGAVIASVGQTGQADSPHLHFEVRKENVARNPLYYLPPPRHAGIATRGTGS